LRCAEGAGEEEGRGGIAWEARKEGCDEDD